MRVFENWLLRLVVNYDVPLAQLIEQANFDFSDSVFGSGYFKPELHGVAEIGVRLIRLCHDETAYDFQIKNEFEKMRQIPLNAHELVFLGNKYPNIQTRLPILALLSSWNNGIGRIFYPCLDSCEKTRRLLLCPNQNFGHNFLFAARA